MTREEAIAIIRKEYLCVDRDCDIERSCGKCDLMMPSKEPILKAYEMAMQALSQECVGSTQKHVENTLGMRCDDAISRQAVLDMWRQISCRDRTCPYRDEGRCTETFCDFKLFEYEINHMPLVKPQYTDDEIQAMQDLEQAEIQKAYALGQEDRPTGHWKRISMDKYSEHSKYWYRCDRCGKDNLGNTDWCPNCGAKMESEDKK